MRGDVLSDSQIEELIEEGSVLNADKNFVNPGSLDLRLGPDVWRLTGSVLPLEGQEVSNLLGEARVVDSLHKKRGQGDCSFFVDRDNPYLFKLVEHISLPEGISARTFNKSGRGRIGTSVKVLCDGVPEFDFIPAGYKGPLYAEVHPTIFPELVRLGETAMPQIRFYEGTPGPLKGKSLGVYIEKDPVLVDRKGKPIAFSEGELERICDSGMFTFTVDLSRGLLAYRAKRDGRTLDLSKEGHYSPSDFFEEISLANGDKGLLLHPGDFVLMHSREAIRLSRGLAAEIAEYTSKIGDFKSHYAGLINPGHGYSEEDLGGAHIVFEVRARDTPIYLQHGQPLARFELYRMSKLPELDYMTVKSTGFDDLPSILPSSFRKGD